jgi:hypothetical protein
MKIVPILAAMSIIVGCSRHPLPQTLTDEEAFLAGLTGVVAIAFGTDREVAVTNANTGAVIAQTHFFEVCRTEEEKAVSDLVTELASINKHGDEAHATFSGTLPWIVLLDGDGDVVADVMVTCSDSSIDIGRHVYFDQGRMLFGTNFTTYADGINRDFGRLAYQFLLEHAPAEISSRNELYYRVGFTNGLWQALGLDKADAQQSRYTISTGALRYAPKRDVGR